MTDRGKSFGNDRGRRQRLQFEVRIGLHAPVAFHPLPPVLEREPIAIADRKAIELSCLLLCNILVLTDSRSEAFKDSRYNASNPTQAATDLTTPREQSNVTGNRPPEPEGGGN